MEKLEFKELKVDEAMLKGFKHISLKRDGTQLYFVDGELISNRDCYRNNRFPHIVKLLKKFDINNVIGEMYIEKGNIFDITSKINWGNARYMFFDIVSNQSLEQKQALIAELVDKINNPSITKPMLFISVKEGWEYVTKNNGEGLILKNGDSRYKVKKLNEAKVKIIGLETGLQKGAFLLENGGKVSATSRDFVEKYNRLSNGNEILAEIEYPFKTKDGKFFQPRLRDLIIKER